MGADTTQEGTEQEVPEAAAMAAVSTHSPSTSKVPSPAPEAPSTVPSSSTPPKEVKEESSEGAAGLRDILTNVPEESNNHRVSTFMTEVDDCEDLPEGPKAAAANLAATMADIAEKITEGVEVVGGIEDVVEKKETTPANTESAVKEATPEPVKEVSSEPVQESSSDTVKETSPGPVKEATPEPTDKKASPEQSPGPTLEPIGAVEDLKAEVNALLSSSDKDNVEVIDIAVIEEPEDSANDVESKIESVLNEIPEKKEIIEEAKEVLDNIETQPKEPTDTGSVIDIRVVEEATDGAQDVVKLSQEGFIAEVIPDNADVEIVAEADEEEPQDSPPSPMVTEAPTPDMEEDVIQGLGAIQESPEEAAADVQAKKKDDEPTSHEPSNEETNESKVSLLISETKPENDESGKDVMEEEEGVAVAEKTVENDTVIEENPKDEAVPVVKGTEAQEESKPTDESEEKSEGPVLAESESPVSEQNSVAEVTNGVTDEPEATTEDITAPVDPLVEEISIAEATLGSDDSVDSDGGEAVNNEAEGGEEASPEEQSETVVGNLKATTLIDITVIEETDDTTTNTAVLEAASTNAQVELEAALNEIPEIPAESVQQILQDARVSVAEEVEATENSLKESSRGWCCYFFAAVLFALLAMAIAATYIHREELALLYDPPIEPEPEEEADSGYWYFTKGLAETFAAAE